MVMVRPQGRIARAVGWNERVLKHDHQLDILAAVREALPGGAQGYTCSEAAPVGEEWPDSDLDLAVVLDGPAEIRSVYGWQARISPAGSTSMSI